MAWVLDEIVQAEVDRLKRLRAMVDGLPPAKVTLVGDVMLDRYVRGWANRLNATAPVPAVKVTEATAAPSSESDFPESEQIPAGTSKLTNFSGCSNSRLLNKFPKDSGNGRH